MLIFTSNRNRGRGTMVDGDDGGDDDARIKNNKNQIS